MSSRPGVALLLLAAVLALTGVGAGLGSAGVGAGLESAGGDAGGQSPAVVAERGGGPGDDRAVAQASTHTPTPNATRSPASVTMRLRVQADGDARWQVSATFAIRDASDAAGFEALASQFEDAQSPLGLDAFRLAVDNASAATGRGMELRNIQRTSSRTATEGTLTLAFTWSNFARTEGDRLLVGDAFNTTDGTWLPRLSERQTLVVRPPSGYGVVSAPSVGIVDGAARWQGPYRFDGREPWVVYSGDAPTPTVGDPTTASPATGAGPPPTSAGPGTTDDGDGGLPSVLPVALLVLVAGASAAVLAGYMRREDYPGFGDAATEGGDDGDGGHPGTAPGSGADGPPGTAGSTGAASPDAGTGTGEDGADADTEDAVDEALLSDEERVERLLERNGGRMKQANIVKETGWSNAKVSQLLSSMAEEDRIDKLRIGRENLISFPDEDVADVDSDDE